jgi:hypothetical protein
LDPELDLRQLAELRDTLGDELPEIVATLVRELDDAVGRAETSIAGGDLAAAALAAHAARNSALMVGARPLMEALGALETGAGRGDLEAARGALARIRPCWRAVRGELLLAAKCEE